MKKKILVAVVVLVIAGAGLGYYVFKQQSRLKESVPAAVDFSEVGAGGSQQEQVAAGMVLTSEPAVLPTELNLKMAFYTQAPFSDWSMPWQEACEEASILLVANEYFHHRWSRENFRDEILKLVEWQTKTFGDYKDTNASQIQRMLKEYLGLESVIYKDPSFADIQKVLDRGHFIVMTFAGKQIGNPNYRNGGPLYHAMVIKGYKAGASSGGASAVQKVITADVGTRNGEDYVYNWSTLQRALHDFTTPIDNGAKLMIEVLPPSLASRGINN